jgi:hypothetical protein
VLLTKSLQAATAPWQLGCGVITQTFVFLVSQLAWKYAMLLKVHFWGTFWQKHATSDPALVPLSLEVKPDFHYVRPWQTPVDNPGVQAVVKTFQEYEGSAPAVGGKSISCDLAIYGEIGNMPAVILGPKGGDLHAPDEWEMK